MFYVLLIIYGIYAATLQGTRPIISLFANAQGSSAFIIGLLVSCFALLPMLLAVTIGKWLDRYGARLMVIIGAGGFLAAWLVPILFPNVAALFFSQLLTGFSHPFILMSFQKTVGNLPGDRDKLIATFYFTGSLGELIGPLVSGFLYEHFGFKMSMAYSVTAVLLALLLGLMLNKNYWNTGASSAKDKNPTKESPWKMLKHSDLRKALIISGMVLYSKDLYVAFFPVYAASVGLSAGTIGVILSFKGAMAMVVRFSQYHLVKQFGRGLVLTTTLVISGIAFVLVPGTANIVILAVLTGLLGGGLGLGQPLSLVYAMDLTPPGRQGGILGLRITFNRLSQFVAPFLIGGIGGIAGVVPVFWVSGGILLVASYFTRIKPHPAPQPARQDQIGA